ncbi:hypothetical protein CTA1_12380 [Colletotrichum tanaceti]|uniref:Uncharacterized protein n=1 Tax=Colletotrichum tanaceti TaxID=1306861 RepID=A0A4U6XM46_9PEZI|nr:hypothetical protein CTA1_12380 [Colletotrichum tanaceti]
MDQTRLMASTMESRSSSSPYKKKPQMDFGHLPRVGRPELHRAVDVAQVKPHEAALELVLLPPRVPGKPL